MTLACDGHLCGHMRTVVPTNSLLKSFNIQQTPAKVFRSSIVYVPILNSWLQKCQSFKLLVSKSSKLNIMFFHPSLGTIFVMFYLLYLKKNYDKHVNLFYNILKNKFHTYAVTHFFVLNLTMKMLHWKGNSS
jgi:hypothetical protein